jgi:hypothetical protein
MLRVPSEFCNPPVTVRMAHVQKSIQKLWIFASLSSCCHFERSEKSFQLRMLL